MYPSTSLLLVHIQDTESGDMLISATHQLETYRKRATAVELLEVKLRPSEEMFRVPDCTALSALGRGSGPFRAMFTEACHKLFVIVSMCVRVCVWGRG